MTLEIIVVLLVGFACVAFVARPILASRTAASGLAEGLRARLRREKDGHLTSLREMEFDYRTGKLAEDDYAAMRSEVETRAIEALRQLDAVEASVGLDAQLEEEIRALKASIAARGAGAGGVRA